MNIKTKLWLYDKTATDYKGTEYTDYIQLGDQNKDTLDETLGGAELTLVGLNFRKEFDPSTKFIWEQYNIVDGQEILIATKYLMVDSDYVSQPILSDDNYFRHHITFLEAAVVAQKRIVDDIAVTYKLKDVNLFGDAGIDTQEKANTKFNNYEPAPSENFHKRSGPTWNRTMYYGRKYQWEWATWLASSSYPNYNDYIQNIWTEKYQNIDVHSPTPITLSIPMLAVYAGKENTTQYEDDRQGFCAIDVKLKATDMEDGTETIIEDYVINPCSDNETENQWNASWFDIWSGNIDKGKVFNRFFQNTGFMPVEERYIKTLAKHKNTYDPRTITFTPVENKKYTLSVKLHNYTDDVNDPSNDQLADNGNLPTATYYQWSNDWFGFVNATNTPTYITNELPSATLEFFTYDSAERTYPLFTSAPPANAYDLFVKSVLCSQDTYKKENGVAITDQETVFYVDDQYVDELKSTPIYENTYHQNNLWQILVEIGKYIHSIPLVRFGKDDRFEVSFTRLGRTDESENNNTVKFGIYNHRTMEDYISSTSSYVNNLVQGGGIIQEVVAPKSTSNDYLVYNDVAKLITSKNIIELVKLEVRDTTIPNGQWLDMTYYVFEKNVYELLPIIKNQPNNKGISIYYSLGTNIIEGFDYILPSVSEGSNDYAIKNILAIVFNLNDSSNIKVNNYVFRITYRTKDSARVDQTRPDLRKYLLNSTMDYAPLQYQFNNQQDRVLDAQRFGNNIYGKLIKTGNTSFEISEWVEDLANLKQVGELYRLPEDENNLYYVATVENTNYGSYITSNVTFSKDYNELSNMIGIPSEPRFYEIATENLIQREVPNNNYLMLGSGHFSTLVAPPQEKRKTFVYGENGMTYVKQLLFDANTDYPKYALTCFKNDIDRVYGNVIDNNKKYTGVLVPISTYSVQNTLNMEYDMVDNLSAGDKVGNVEVTDGGHLSNNKAYRTLSAVQYTDAHGRDDMFDMVILKDVDLTNDQIRNLPESPYAVSTYNNLFEDYLDYREIVFECNRVTYPDVDGANGWQPQFYDWANAQGQLTPPPQSFSGDLYIRTKFEYQDAIYGTYYKYGIIKVAAQYPPNDTPYMFIIESYLIDGEPQPITEYDFNDLDKPLFDENDCVFSTMQEDAQTHIGDNTRGKILLKDNREIISINTNIHIITDSDRFVVSGDLWAMKKGTVKLALLRNEVSKIINNKISSLDVIETFDITPTVVGYGSPTYYGIQIPIYNTLVDIYSGGMLNVKGLALIVDENLGYTPEKYTFVMAKNLGGLSDAEKRENWYIAPKDIWEN